MKLLLTSTGLANQSIIDAFLKLLDKPIPKIKVIFVPAAARTEEELGYVDGSRKELLMLGVRENNIKTLYLDRPATNRDVQGFDVIYICGGNTFYLLKKVRCSGFDKVIQEFVKDGKLYFGVSAGSILACPNIRIAAPFDENDVGLEDLAGLGLVNVIVSPHYCEKESAIVEEFVRNSRIPVIPIANNQALLVNDNCVEII